MFDGRGKMGLGFRHALPLALMVSSLWGCQALNRSTEAFYYDRAKIILADAVSRSSLPRCNLAFNLPHPMFERVRSGSLFPAAARYHADTRLIEYDEDFPRVIVHEGAHDLLAFSKNDCLTEIAAELAQRIADLEDQNEHLMFSINRSLVNPKRRMP